MRKRVPISPFPLAPWVGLVLCALAPSMPQASPVNAPLAPAEPGKPAAKDLRRIWQDEIEFPEELHPSDDSPLAALRQRTVLFVAGFLNEGINKYFEDNSEVAVRELGMKSYIYTPSSNLMIPEAAEWVRRFAVETRAKHKRPVILIGHSKGGAEVLYAVLAYPELILDGTVEKAVLIQAAVGGSPVAKQVIASQALYTIVNPFKKGLDSLDPEKTRALFDERIRKLRDKIGEEDFQKISSRVFYVRAYQTSYEVAPILELTHRALRDQGSGQSDGLLLVEDQIRSDIGTDLTATGPLRADHAGLTCNHPFSNVWGKTRKAFTRALFKRLYENVPAN